MQKHHKNYIMVYIMFDLFFKVSKFFKVEFEIASPLIFNIYWSYSCIRHSKIKCRISISYSIAFLFWKLLFHADQMRIILLCLIFFLRIFFFYTTKNLFSNSKYLIATLFNPRPRCLTVLLYIFLQLHFAEKTLWFCVLIKRKTLHNLEQLRF